MAQDKDTTAGQGAQAATPRPWAVKALIGRRNVDATAIAFLIPGGFRVAECDMFDAPNKANADLIVRAVNAHDALLSAVTRAQAVLARAILPTSDLPDHPAVSGFVGELLDILDDQELVKTCTAAGHVYGVKHG